MKLWHTYILSIWLYSITAWAADVSDLVQIRSQLAIEYTKLGNMEVALSEANQAVALNDKNMHKRATPYVARAYVNETLKQYDAAENDYKKALSIEPHSPEANNNYGLLLCERHRVQDSLAYFQKALDNPLNNAPQNAYLNLGRCNIKLGNNDKGNEYLLKAVQQSPGFRPALLELAKLHLVLKHGTLAAFYFDQAAPSGVKLTPEELWLGVRIGRHLGNASMEAKYSGMLKTSYPSAKETQYLLGDRKP